MDPDTLSIDVDVERFRGFPSLAYDVVCAQMYARQRRLVLRSAILRETLARSMIEQRIAWIGEHRRSLHAAFRIRHEALDEAVQIDRAQFVCVRGTVLPVPKAEVLKEPLPASASALLRASPGLSSIQREVLEASLREGAVSTTQTIPFRSTAGSAGRIYGRDAANVESLAGLAHELGHIEAEVRYPVSSLADQILSEVSAHLFESDMVISVIPSAQVPDWQAYEAAVDRLNLRLCQLECGDILGLSLTDDLFSECSLLFRDSYFVVPGYQLVNAYASRARMTRREEQCGGRARW